MEWSVLHKTNLYMKRLLRKEEIFFFYFALKSSSHFSKVNYKNKFYGTCKTILRQNFKHYIEFEFCSVKLSYLRIFHSNKNRS